MKFTHEIPTTLTIRSVTVDEICIGNEVFDHTIAITVDLVLHDWAPKNVEDLQESDFDLLLGKSPEVIVLGTGATNVFPARELVFAMARSGVGLEVMNTIAAARTYNVLAGEDRKVAAVLYV